MGGKAKNAMIEVSRMLYKCLALCMPSSGGVSNRQEAGQDAGQETGEEAGQEVGQNALQNAGQEAVQDTGLAVAKSGKAGEGTEEGQDAEQEVGQEAGQDGFPVAKSGKAGKMAFLTQLDACSRQKLGCIDPCSSQDGAKGWYFDIRDRENQCKYKADYCDFCGFGLFKAKESCQHICISILEDGITTNASEEVPQDLMAVYEVPEKKSKAGQGKGKSGEMKVTKEMACAEQRVDCVDSCSQDVGAKGWYFDVRDQDNKCKYHKGGCEFCGYGLFKSKGDCLSICDKLVKDEDKWQPAPKDKMTLHGMSRLDDDVLNLN